MADYGSISRGLLEGVMEAFGRIGVEKVEEKVTGGPAKQSKGAAHSAGGAIVNHLKSLEKKEERRLLYRALSTMPPTDRKNILGLLEQKLEDCTENDLVTSLGIMIDEDDTADTLKPLLKGLNDSLPNIEPVRPVGEILLELLNEDGKQQFAARILREGKILGRKLRDEHLPEIKRAAEKLGPAGDSAAEVIGGFASWLERNGGR